MLPSHHTDTFSACPLSREIHRFLLSLSFSDQFIAFCPFLSLFTSLLFQPSFLILHTCCSIFISFFFSCLKLHFHPFSPCLSHCFPPPQCSFSLFPSLSPVFLCCLGICINGLYFKCHTHIMRNPLSFMVGGVA